MRSRTIFASLLLLLFALSAAAKDRFRYIYSLDGNTVISGASVEKIVKYSKRWKSPFFWAEWNGREYLTQDAATLSQVREAFGPVNALHDEHERVRDRMKPVEKREAKLERRIDYLSDTLSDEEDLTSSERAAMKRELEELQREMRPVAQQLRELEEEEERIDEREEVLTAQAERKLRAIMQRAIDRGLAQRVD